MEGLDIRSWTWVHLAVATAVYWLVVGGSWWYYTTRPSRQARARTAADLQVLPQADAEVRVYSKQINLVPILAVLVGPPALLVLFRVVF